MIRAGYIAGLVAMLLAVAQVAVGASTRPTQKRDKNSKTRSSAPTPPRAASPQPNSKPARPPFSAALASPATGPSIDLAAAAASDLVQLYQAAAGTTDPAALASRLASGLAAVHEVRLVGNRDADPMLEAPVLESAGLLLRLHTLEAMALASGRDADGLRCAAEADSLEAALRRRLDELPAGTGAILPLAAGLRPGRAEAVRLDAALRAAWFERGSRPGTEVAARNEFLLFHVLAARDTHLLLQTEAGPPRDSWDAALRQVRDLVAGNRVRLFAADDPLRRLQLAVHALCSDGALPADTWEIARQPLDAPLATPAEYVARCAALDTLAARLGDDNERAVPILGTRRDYYRKAGQVAPTLDPAMDDLARRTARRAIRDLRGAAGNRVLENMRLQTTCELEPVEVVPGQQVAAVWTVGAARLTRLSDATARIGDASLGVTPATVTIDSAGLTVLRTGYAALPLVATGVTLAPALQLRFTLEGWGAIEIHDRLPLRIVAPLQASVTPVGGDLVFDGSKRVEVFVTSRAPRPVEGTLRVLATTDWKIGPAPLFRFMLRRPGQSARAELDVQPPALASPGAYEFALRLEADGQAVGTLRMQMVKPVQWVVIGPFAPPAGRALLGPESGVSVESRHQGLDGMQVAWQTVPPEAYDPDGSLDLEALYPEQRREVCACAFTVFDSPEGGSAVLGSSGATRIWWNGEMLRSDAPVRLLRGRNTLLVRACSTPQSWALDTTLRDAGGAPLRVVANDLPRLVAGYASLGRAAPRVAGGQPPDRLVMLRFRTPAAASEVAVLGTFNAWVPVELQRQPDGTWQRELRLTPGRYAYKLLVDGRLRPDPEAHSSEPDGFGGRNSLLIVR